MPEIKIFPDEELPEHLKWQVISFQRIEWPDGYEGPNLYRDWISHPHKYPTMTHVTMVEGQVLLSYAEVIGRDLEHAGQVWRVYGIAGMLTFPTVRRMGPGLQVAQAAMELPQDVDVWMFYGVQNGIYEKAGWRLEPDVKATCGDPAQPELIKDSPYMLFVSDRAKHSQQLFRGEVIYFGEEQDL